MNPTHIQTLTPNTPKGRRRARKVLGIVDQSTVVDPTLAVKAQEAAYANERAHKEPAKKGKK